MKLNEFFFFFLIFESLSYDKEVSVKKTTFGKMCLQSENIKIKDLAKFISKAARKVNVVYNLALQKVLNTWEVEQQIPMGL